METSKIDTSGDNSAQTVMGAVTPNIGLGYRFFKRLIDIVGSLIVLAVLSPLLILIAVLIKIDDPKADVIYKQLRTGKGGKPFCCYKFRTMAPNADLVKDQLMSRNEMDGPVFKIRDDPRVTNIGKMIRRLSIDEFPQFFNVLKGDLSLVGPRPLPVAEAEACNAFQKQRELVKPGITCIWQISGRNDISFLRWMEMDIEYISRQSFWVDIAILIKTIPAVLFTAGAS